MTASRLLDRPVFVVGCNRSGTTLLFLTLSGHPEAWSHYEELSGLYHEVAPVHPERGERLKRVPSPGDVGALERRLFEAAHNKELHKDWPVLRHLSRKLLQPPLSRLWKEPPLRLVEKTPANALRVPFLAEAFPDARFVFLVRRAEAAISSLMEGWKIWSGTGDGDWAFRGWHYLAPPGWREWTGRSLAEICAFQWVEANRAAWDDLRSRCPDRYLLVRHEEALADPAGTYREIREFCELPPSGYFDRQVARLGATAYPHPGSDPRPGKWRDLHGEEVESVRELFQPLMDELYPEEGTRG